MTLLTLSLLKFLLTLARLLLRYDDSNQQVVVVENLTMNSVKVGGIPVIGWNQPPFNSHVDELITFNNCINSHANKIETISTTRGYSSSCCIISEFCCCCCCCCFGRFDLSLLLLVFLMSLVEDSSDDNGTLSLTTSSLTSTSSSTKRFCSNNSTWSLISSSSFLSVLPLLLLLSMVSGLVTNRLDGILVVLLLPAFAWW